MMHPQCGETMESDFGPVTCARPHGHWGAHEGMSEGGITHNWPRIGQYETGRLVERKDVVEWLRIIGENAEKYPSSFEYLAECIERGDHVPVEKP